ncbi:hypothetical protein [Phenylobacterium sp.]|uniref:hypothetical protein n=1 Tax=Phenylobacterium sp. TaxID=1871053 RepID=UPI0025D656F6|nr:hypothetical protein [Phenylobacterium sp.]MCA6360576.1 hypothetical protein [Phenylobacterium sp.]
MSDWSEHDGGPPPVAYDLSQYVRHLIDAARLEGIRLGLMAAERAIKALYVECPATAWRNALEDASMDVRNLKPETIAREAQDMGSGKETT